MKKDRMPRAAIKTIPEGADAVFHVEAALFFTPEI